jgi:hypothetical protein
MEKKTDNTALARFITSLGSLNSYGSTVLQTKQALDARSTKPLRQNVDDIAIYQDALKGISAIKQVGFSADGIIAINRVFDSPSDEEPNWPGHLRNAMYNENDRIGIIVDSKAKEAYFPPEHITKADIEKIVDRYKQSGHHERDAWRVFADLAKLQPFQDGNKRTALIAANAAYGTLENQNYLVFPFNDLDRAEFTINLMRYYQATTPANEGQAFEKMLSFLPTNREVLLRKPITTTDVEKAKTIRYKEQLRSLKEDGAE